MDVRNGQGSGEFVALTPEQAMARKRRGQLLALLLFGFVGLVFMITLTRLGENAKAASQSRDFSDAVKLYSEDGQEIDAAGRVVENDSSEVGE
jgi:hypothetical protein